MMFATKFGVAAAAAITIIASTTGAQAICSNNWADVTITCPKPVPFTGPKKLTPTSRNMPTVGTPGTYDMGNGRTVTVYLYKNGTGYQPFHWENQ